MDLYSISDWDVGGVYAKNGIVRTGPVNGLYSYWYSTQDNNSGNTPSLTDSHWAGRSASLDGLPQNSNFSSDGAYAQFIWAPSYDPQIRINAKVKQVQFGDGYNQITKDGINNTLLELDLSFDGRDLNEGSAILHFLNARSGYETFLFTPPSPYARQKRWKCIQWSNSQPFYDNYNIKATFLEVVI